MKVLRRYFAGEIYRSVFFALLAFLALFSFFDLIGELNDVGRGPYRLEHAFLYVALGMPAYAYELMPIVSMIGTIYVMAQFAARSEFTVMRASALSMGRALAIIVRIAVILAVITFLLGEFVAPKSNEFRRSFKRGIEGSALSAEFRSGLWAKDIIRDASDQTVTGSRFLNARKIDPDGAIRDVNVFEFDTQMHMLARISADKGVYQGQNVWTLTGVDEMRLQPVAAGSNVLQPEVASRRKLATLTLRSDITPEILAVTLADPEKMSAVDLVQFSRHLEENKQRNEQYEIALWRKLLYPVALIVMMVLALPFAYLQARSGGLSLKIFAGIMIGMAFHLMNNLFSHLGLLNTWPPLATAMLPSLLFLLAAIAALWWVERH